VGADVVGVAVQAEGVVGDHYVWLQLADLCHQALDHLVEVGAGKGDAGAARGPGGTGAPGPPDPRDPPAAEPAGRALQPVERAHHGEALHRLPRQPRQGVVGRPPDQLEPAGAQGGRAPAAAGVDLGVPAGQAGLVALLVDVAQQRQAGTAGAHLAVEVDVGVGRHRWRRGTAQRLQAIAQAAAVELRRPGLQAPARQRRQHRRQPRGRGGRGPAAETGLVGAHQRVAPQRAAVVEHRGLAPAADVPRTAA
jgi:hypothetical protein